MHLVKKIVSDEPKFVSQDRGGKKGNFQQTRRDVASLEVEVEPKLNTEKSWIYLARLGLERM